VDPNDDMTFSLLIQKGILEHRDLVEELSRKAERSWNIEKKLNEMFEKMREVRVEVQLHKATGTYIFK
jgi:dynein heavy chain